MTVCGQAFIFKVVPMLNPDGCTLTHSPRLMSVTTHLLPYLTAV